ncbi:anti-sigma regulatory factor [Streptomyces sp. ME109]|uniref:anti-sigma regulatory factor n=1 Tax=Streptomyces sp. me109 TaxID=1827853 RepID=UPI0016514C77|nr:anti-sigma regulatory factor [Streptomyces sp. me109]
MTPLVDCEDVAWFRDEPQAARGAAAALGRRIGLDEHRTAELVLAVTELATNMAKHSQDGSLVLRVLRTPQVAGVEVVVVDQGPGMADVATALRDGTSSTGTLGIGLGAVQRLADTFDIHSRPGLGTVQLARFWPRPLPFPPDAEPAIGGITRPISGETACGDAWATRTDDGTLTVRAPSPPAGERGTSTAPPVLDWSAVTRPHLPGRTAPAADRTASAARTPSDRTASAARTPSDRSGSAGRSALVRSAVPGPGRAVLVMSCDGLGHGPMAALAGQAAAQALRTSTARTPEEIMQHVHRACGAPAGQRWPSRGSRRTDACCSAASGTSPLPSSPRAPGRTCSPTPASWAIRCANCAPTSSTCPRTPLSSCTPTVSVTAGRRVTCPACSRTGPP